MDVMQLHMNIRKSQRTDPNIMDSRLASIMPQSTVNKIPPIHEKSYLLCQKKCDVNTPIASLNDAMHAYMLSPSQHVCVIAVCVIMQTLNVKTVRPTKIPIVIPAAWRST